MDTLPTLTTEIVIVMLIIVFAVFILATELLRVDVAGPADHDPLGPVDIRPRTVGTIDSECLVFRIFQ